MWKVGKEEVDTWADNPTQGGLMSGWDGPCKCVCRNSCNFFWREMCVTKKIVQPCNFFFAVSHVSPSHALPQTKNYTTRHFFVHAYRKKNTRRDDFFPYTHLPQNKNYTTYRKKITRSGDFFLHTVTAKVKKLHDLTAKKQLPILLKMHACRQCAHLWATSDFPPCLALGTPENAGVT